MTGKEQAGHDQAGAGEEVSQGYSYTGDDETERNRAIDAGFDYRGDVTLTLDDGAEITGFIANRNPGVPEPFVEFFPTDGSERQRLPYARIRGVTLSGRDMASGKTWEAWIGKWKAKQEAEARGEDVGDISLYPEKID